MRAKSSYEDDIMKCHIMEMTYNTLWNPSENAV